MMLFTVLLHSMQRQRFKNVQRLKDHPADTAKNFIVEGHRGTVSFITSMTEHFCAGCNRLRLLADGNFKVCLFGPAEVCYQFILCLSPGSNFYVSIFNGLQDIFLKFNLHSVQQICIHVNFFPTFT